jgi:hypothetical protein
MNIFVQMSFKKGKISMFFFKETCGVGRAKINGFPTLRKNLTICGPKNFQPSIQTKFARIKTRAEKYNGYDLRCVSSRP